MYQFSVTFVQCFEPQGRHTTNFQYRYIDNNSYHQGTICNEMYYSRSPNGQRDIGRHRPGVILRDLGL